MIRQTLLEYRLPVVKQDERRFEFAAVQRTVVKKQTSGEDFSSSVPDALGTLVGLQIEPRRPQKIEASA